MINHESNGKRSHFRCKQRQEVMYGQSTCVWCKKTRQLLTDLGIDFDYVYVDLLSGDEEESAVREVSRFNPHGSFPTVIINDEKAILGFDEQAIRKAFSS